MGVREYLRAPNTSPNRHSCFTLFPVRIPPWQWTHMRRWIRCIAPIGGGLLPLIRVAGDFDVAEEAAQEAFTAAVDQWPTIGVPD